MREYIGKDADGNDIYTGDIVEIIPHKRANPDVVGHRREAVGPVHFPPPPELEEELGEGFFDAIDDNGQHGAMHLSMCRKVEK